MWGLAAAAWREEPPCSLPDDRTYLANVVGISDELMPRLTKLAAAFTRGADGRLHLTKLRAIYDRLAGQAAAARSRTAAATAAAAAARRRERGAPPIALPASVTDEGPSVRHGPVRNGSVTDPLRTDAPSWEARAHAERSALLRSSDQNAILRSLSAQSAEVIARIGGAGARAQVEQRIEAWRRQRVLSMLTAFVEKLRASRRTTAPVTKAHELAMGKFSTPARVATAIQRVEDKIAAEDCGNPIGLLIAVLGLGPWGAKRLIEVPIYIAQHWDDQETKIAKDLACAVARAAVLQERREHTGGHAAASGAS